MRITLDFHDNEVKQNAYLTDKFAEIIKAMGAKEVVKQYRKAPYDVTEYQTTIYGRRDHGDRPLDQRAQPLSAKLFGCPFTGSDGASSAKVAFDERDQ